MILVLDAVLLALLVGLLTGGRLPTLTRLKLRGEGVLLAGLLAQLLLPRLVPGGMVTGRIAVWLFWGVPGVLVLAALLLNWRSLGAVTAGVGVGLNMLVVLVNTGMPVSVATGAEVGFLTAPMLEQIQASWLHIEMTPFVRLAVLADVIPVVGPVWHRGMVSLGDIMLAAGVAYVVFNQMHADGTA